MLVQLGTERGWVVCEVNWSAGELGGPKDRLSTCHLHGEGAAVVAVLVGGHKGHFSCVIAPHLEQLQRVLVIVRHRHVTQAGLAGQNHSPPEKEFK